MSHKAIRYESFGGIIGLEEPPALVFVDREFMKNLGYDDSPLWHDTKEYLSAPTEVHFNITNFCPLHCRHCTSGSGDCDICGMSTGEIKNAIDVLAGMKVFHIAFGGGELFSRPDAIEIAEYAYSKGIIPNATTNGYYMTPELAKKCRVFGQINISIDGIGRKYGAIRGIDIFERADRALKLLMDEGVTAGINCIASRINFDSLEEVVAYAHGLNLKEVLFLRVKPSGRARNVYHEYKLTHQQNLNFFPFLINMVEKYKPNIQVDCSMIPNLCYHKPSKKIMGMFGVEGCEGGNILLGVRHDGWVNACSHFTDYFEDITQLPQLWNGHKHFRQFRERTITNKGCKSCGYFKICRGGCPLFSEFLEGDFNLPDPECPILVEKSISGLSHKSPL